MTSAADPGHGVEAVALDTDLISSQLGKPRALYVGVTGNVSLVASDGSVATFVAVPGGTVLPVRFKRVNSSGTTASSLVAIY